jgi:hypothetical protein
MELLISDATGKQVWLGRHRFIRENNVHHGEMTLLLRQDIFTMRVTIRETQDLEMNGVDMLFFFYLHSGGWSPIWVHSARRPLTGLLYLPRVIVTMKKLVEWMAGETEVLGENLPSRHFFHHKSHLTRPGIEPGPPRWEASD